MRSASHPRAAGTANSSEAAPCPRPLAPAAAQDLLRAHALVHRASRAPRVGEQRGHSRPSRSRQRLGASRSALRALRGSAGPCPRCRSAQHSRSAASRHPRAPSSPHRQTNIPPQRSAKQRATASTYQAPSRDDGCAAPPPVLSCSHNVGYASLLGDVTQTRRAPTRRRRSVAEPGAPVTIVALSSQSSS